MSKAVVVVLCIGMLCASSFIVKGQLEWRVKQIYKESDFNKEAYNLYMDDTGNFWVIYPSKVKDIEKKTVMMEKYDRNKNLLLKFDTKIAYINYYNYKFDEKKIGVIAPVGRYYPHLTIIDSKVYLFDPYNCQVVLYNSEKKQRSEMPLSYGYYFSYFDFPKDIEIVKKSYNNTKEKHHMNWLYGKLLVDKNNSLYVLESNYIVADEGFSDDFDIEHSSHFMRFAEDGSPNIPDGVITHENNAGLCIYYNPSTNLIYYFGGFDWNLKIYDINFNKITEVDVFEKKKWNNFNDIINYYLTKESSHGASWIVTIYSDKDGNVYISNLNNITILDNKYQPKDVISGYNLKELTDTMIIDEVVKAEENRMWIKVRRCIKGEHFTSNAVYEMELWEIEKK